jgi:hypothetical protein
MTEAETRSRCVCCGVDLTHGEHHKNRYGECICLACHQAGRRSPRAEASAIRKYRCATCGTEVGRQECHKNRYGEYICLPCYDKGKRFSRRRFIERKMRRWAIRFFYVALGVLGLWVALIILGKMIKLFSSGP